MRIDFGLRLRIIHELRISVAASFPSAISSHSNSSSDAGDEGFVADRHLSDCDTCCIRLLITRVDLRRSQSLGRVLTLRARRMSKISERGLLPLNNLRGADVYICGVISRPLAYAGAFDAFSSCARAGPVVFLHHGRDSSVRFNRFLSSRPYSRRRSQAAGCLSRSRAQNVLETPHGESTGPRETVLPQPRLQIAIGCSLSLSIHSISSRRRARDLPFFENRSSFA